MRRAAKRDGNHNAIVQALEQIGCTVLDLSRLGGDAPDILCGYRGESWLLEIKNPEGRNRLSEGQQEFLATWRGKAAVVRSVYEAVGIVTGEIVV